MIEKINEYLTMIIDRMYPEKNIEKPKEKHEVYSMETRAHNL